MRTMVNRPFSSVMAETPVSLVVTVALARGRPVPEFCTMPRTSPETPMTVATAA